MRVAFIVNPTAGKKHIGVKVSSKLTAWALQENIEAAVFLTEYAGHAIPLAQKAAQEGYPIVVAVGGDGTVREVGMGLLGTDAHLGIIPIGSGNGIARHLGIPLIPQLAVAALAHLTRGFIDVGYVNNHPFFMAFGLGFDAEVAALFANLPHRGLESYISAGWQAFKTRKPFKITLTTGGQSSEHEALMVTTANGSQFGNNAYIAPHASMQDGYFDVTLIKNVSDVAISEIVGAVFSKNIGRLSTIEQWSLKEASFSLEAPIAYHLDGEPMGTDSSFRVIMKPRALGVLYHGFEI